MPIGSRCTTWRGLSLSNEKPGSVVTDLGVPAVHACEAAAASATAGAYGASR